MILTSVLCVIPRTTVSTPRKQKLVPGIRELSDFIHAPPLHASTLSRIVPSVCDSLAVALGESETPRVLPLFGSPVHPETVAAPRFGVPQKTY